MNDAGDRVTADSAGDAFDTPIHVEDEAHLDELVETSHVLLVDFYADWCGPCQMLEPTVERLAAETAATVAKVDIDELRELARANEVQGVPTMLLYVDGELTERVVGVRDEGTLRELVTSQYSSQ